MSQGFIFLATQKFFLGIMNSLVNTENFFFFFFGLVFT